jgi:hypothetical protein
MRSHERARAPGGRLRRRTPPASPRRRQPSLAVSGPTRVISLGLSRLESERVRRTDWWPLLAATTVTCGAFMSVLLSLHSVLPGMVLPSRMREPATERIVLVEPRTTSMPLAPAPAQPRARASARMPTAPVASAPPPDTGATPAPAMRSATTPGPPPPSPAITLDAAPRLARPLPERAGRWMVPRVAFDPFAEPAPPSPAEADSVLSALSTRVPDLAARRVPTMAERDAASKEAMLKIRQSGRILLVPPDNSGGMITAPLPFLSRGPSRAARARDERALDEGRARLRRLQARVDSIRRVHDSLRQQPRTP